MASASPDVVWNRALDFSAHPELDDEGDQALRDVLTFHGSVMNGGLLDAVQTYEDDDDFPIDRVVDGYRFLGLTDAADAIDGALDAAAGADRDDEKAWSALEQELDGSYELEDDDIESALERTIAAEPDAFAPVR